MLLNKMQMRGVPDDILRWIHNFLRERQHRVKIGTFLSIWVSPNGGVPQGTLPGPLHYQTMSNDLATCLDMPKYVDDYTTYDITAQNETSKLQQAVDDTTELGK